MFVMPPFCNSPAPPLSHATLHCTLQTPHSRVAHANAHIYLPARYMLYICFILVACPGVNWV